jgi:pilus assembly protein CpaE
MLNRRPNHDARTKNSDAVVCGLKGSSEIMLTVAVVGKDLANRAVLAKCLQQTGLARGILECADSPDSYPALRESVPEVVLLDLSPDNPTSQFELASFLHRLSPAIRIVACSELAEPDSGLLMQAMRHGVREFLRKPLDVNVLREVLVRFEAERGTFSPSGAKKFIAVIGAKGGVGATTVAVNLSVQLAQISQKRVVLLDLARPMGYASLMLDLQPKFSLREATQSSDRIDGHLLEGLITPHKSGLGVLAGISDPNEWSNIALGAIPRIAEVAQSRSDYVVADLGVFCPQEWTGLLSGARCVLMVSEAHVASLWATERQTAALLARNIDPELLRLVINRWHRRDEGVLKSVEQRTKRNVFLRLPNNFPKVNDAVTTGKPINDNHDNAIVARLREFAIEITGAAAAPRAVPRRGGIGNFFSSNSSR